MRPSDVSETMPMPRGPSGTATCLPRRGVASVLVIAFPSSVVFGERLLVRRRARKIDLEGGAGTVRQERQHAAHVAHQPVGHRQAEARALADRLGGEEGFED